MGGTPRAPAPKPQGTKVPPPRNKFGREGSSPARPTGWGATSESPEARGPRPPRGEGRARVGVFPYPPTDPRGPRRARKKTHGGPTASRVGGPPGHPNIPFPPL